MFLKDLLKQHNINIGSYDLEIEIPDDFEEDSQIEFESQNKFVINSQDEDLSRKVSFDLSEKTITVSFESDLYNGAEVYSLDGKIMKVIN